MITETELVGGVLVALIIMLMYCWLKDSHPSKQRYTKCRSPPNRYGEFRWTDGMTSMPDRYGGFTLSGMRSYMDPVDGFDSTKPKSMNDLESRLLSPQTQKEGLSNPLELLWKTDARVTSSHQRLTEGYDDGAQLQSSEETPVKDCPVQNYTSLSNDILSLTEQTMQ